MNLETIIQKLAIPSGVGIRDQAEIIKHLIELKASLNDQKLNNDLLNTLVEKYAISEKYIASANQKLSQKNKEIKKALTERNVALERLDRELTGAADYVKKILPKPIKNETISIDWRYIPSSSLGGDALGYHWLDHDHIAIYLIDVSGHGIMPALLSVSVINALRSQSLPSTDFNSPETVLAALNRAFPGEKNNEMFFTIWYGVYNKNIRELNFASGGHPPALILNHSDTQHDKIRQLRTPNILIGVKDDYTFVKDTVQIQKNSKLYVYSDGVYEIKRPDGSMWPLDEFIGYVSSFKVESTDSLDCLIEHAGTIGTSAEFEDDFTIMEITFE